LGVAETNFSSYFFCAPIFHAPMGIVCHFDASFDYKLVKEIAERGISISQTSRHHRLFDALTKSDYLYLTVA
jgi:hypothetical protein